MLNSSSNRGTPVSGENITKIVRQNYKPESAKPYRPEVVQCRTNTLCKKGKPENYWMVNYHRRKCNLDKGFYTLSTEPYRPIGGELILDPYELVVTALSGSVERKFQPRMTRRGTIYERSTPIATDQEDERHSEDKQSSVLSDDLVDNCPTAGFEHIKKILRDSRDRITNVKAGMGYEEHVKLVEEIEKEEQEANRPVDTGMVLHSLSSLCLPIPTKEPRSVPRRESRAPSISPRPTSTQPKITILNASNRSSPVSPYSRSSSPYQPGSRSSSAKRRSIINQEGYSTAEKKMHSICTKMDDIRNSIHRRTSRAPSIMKPKSPMLDSKHMNKLALIQCSSGITITLLRKERQFRDHLSYLKWIYNILTALHNLKVKDIRSKIPLSKDFVERLQKEGFGQRDEERSSRGPYGTKWTMRKGCRVSNLSFKGSAEDHDIDFGCNDNMGNSTTPSETSPTKKTTLFPIKRKNLFTSIATKKIVTSKLAKGLRQSSMDVEHEEGGRMSVFGTVKRANAMDAIGKNFFGRRKSRQGTALAPDKPLVETWEDLLNYQPPEIKDDNSTFGFQVGIVTKFMRWYRRASVTPTHAGGAVPTIDMNQLSALQQMNDKTTQPEHKEPNYGGAHQSSGSAQGHTEKARKLPIWQQVAQEKSTVFHNKKSTAPNPDTAIHRFKRDLNKLKRSLQKENNAELEKIVRERVASFRMKFSTLNSEEASCLFEVQKNRIKDVKENFNRSHLENFDVQPSKWYEELREKSLSMVASFEQPEIVQMVTKLQTYAHMDNKTVSYAKAKLCLLMMSLPAYDICQIYVQRALKFIFENILLGQEAQFNEWLSHRKIPYMVLQDRPKSAATNISSS